ncbi:hypothetical protein [Alteromonas sp. H39]|uniref:hypothetical protein n=1 Tax=Alteromonas sp. H39 TaxID=3389876 RepID=UPI0039E03B9F
MWLLPLCYTIAILLISYFAGALNYPDDGNIRAQRDFNAALGMPVVTGYLWFAIRSLHRRTASTIVDFLSLVNRLSDYDYYRALISRKLSEQVLLAASIALLVTIIYLSTEGLLALDLNIRVLLLNMLAVPFWFFIWLYLMQVTSTTLLICNNFVFNEKVSLENVRIFKPISDFAINNLVQAIIGLSIVPVFWFGKEIPAIDVFICVLFSGGIFLYVLWPAFRVNQIVADAKKNKILFYESKMQEIYESKRLVIPEERSALLTQLNRYQDKIDELAAVSLWPVDDIQLFKIGCASLLVGISWLTFTGFVHIAA